MSEFVRRGPVILGAVIIVALLVVAGILLLTRRDAVMEEMEPEAVMPEVEEERDMMEEVMVGPNVGDLAPGFTLTTIDGRVLSLNDFRGKTVVLWFMIPVGCPICVDQARELKALTEEFGDEVVVIAVTLLGYERVSEDLEKFSMEKGSPNWFYAVDRQGLGVKYEIVEMGVILIGADGRILFRGIPSASYEELAEFIRASMG